MKRIFAPGEKEREEIGKRYREICKYAKLAHPLPEEYCNTIENRVYCLLCDDFKRHREKSISKEILNDRIEMHRKAHFKDYRYYELIKEVFKQAQERYMKFSQTLAKLLKFDEVKGDIEEWLDGIFSLVGCEFTEYDEKPLRKKWEKIKQRLHEGAAKPKKAKKEAERHKYGSYENVLLSDSELEKLKEEFPKDFENRIEALSIYIASSGKTYKSHLATIRNWARRDAEKQKEAAAKNAASAASYDIGKFESLENIVGIKYAEGN